MMAGEKVFSILNELLSDDSMKKIINFNILNIVTLIKQKIMINSKNCAKNGNNSRIDELYSELIRLVYKEKIDEITLLHAVAKNGRVETAIRLIKYGANVNAKNKKNETPIYYAVQNSAEMVQVFLNDRNVKDLRLFHHALLCGTEEVFKLLVSKCCHLEIYTDSTQDSTANSKFDEFQIALNTFLQHDFHLKDMEASYPLLIFFAARISRQDIFQMILDDCRNNLATIKQMKIEDDKIVSPEELNVQGRSGETALHLAAILQHVEVARFLLQNGADPNCRDCHDFTPLHFALYFEHEEMCQLLASFGANINPSLGFPVNLLKDFSTNRKRLALFRCISDCNNETVYHQKKSDMFDPTMLKLLLKNGSDPHDLNEEGVPILFDACECACLEELKIFVECGANIRFLDGRGNSALHYAAVGYSLEMVDFLLEQGLDINLSNHLNYTPLMFAAKREASCTEMMEYLVYRGANINAINIFGETVLYMSASNNIVLDVPYLLELGADWSILNIHESRIRYNEFSKIYRRQKILISFIALRQDKLSDRIMFYVGNDDEDYLTALDYFHESTLEVTKLKATTISKDSKISYFDFLTTDFYSSVQIAKNSELRVFLNSRKMQQEFPCYEILLKYRFKISPSLENFVQKTFDFILNYTNLPSKIVAVIMSYLHKRDFRVFGRILSNEHTFSFKPFQE